MFTPFENLNPDSRIWIYQSNRFFTPDEEVHIKLLGQNFVEQWTAHNNNLLGSFEIINQLFLIVAVDESVNDASGCSIDKSFSLIRQIEKDNNVVLLDRTACAFEKDQKIELSEFSTFKKLLKEGYVNTNDMIYNNLVHSKFQLTSEWKIPIKDSWVMQLY